MATYSALGQAGDPVRRDLRSSIVARYLQIDRLYRVNQRCIGCFPSAADVVMGRPVASFDTVAADCANLGGERAR